MLDWSQLLRGAEDDDDDDGDDNDDDNMRNKSFFGYKSAYFKGFVCLWAVLCTKTIMI